MRETERVILTNMCMIYNGDEILVQERVSPSWPGVAFPGGHVERGDPLSVPPFGRSKRKPALTSRIWNYAGSNSELKSAARVVISSCSIGRTSSAGN